MRTEAGAVSTHGRSAHVPPEQSREADLGVHVLLLVATLAAAAIAQGGFAGPSRWLISAGLVASFVVALRRRRLAATSMKGVASALALLAAWTLVRAFTSDGVVSGLWQVALMAGIAIVVFGCRRATADESRALLTALVVIGVAIAVSGWFGVAFRLEPWANPGPSTWRASSTLTYPNAAAALIVVGLMIVLARGRGAALARLDAVGSSVLVAGLLATQSRGGVVALLAGLVTLALFGGLRSLARAAVAPIAGGAVAFAIAFPTVDADRSAQPVLMLAALGVGVAITLALTRVPERATWGATFVLAATPLVAWVARDRFGSAASDRLRLGSVDRADTTREAIDLVGSHPFAGVGPGNVRLVWPSGDRLVTTELVHNEYLQVAAELGIVGALLLAAVLAAGCATVWRVRAPSSSMWLGGVAALVAVGVHSALDFLWHLAVIPLVAATVFGVVTTHANRPDNPRTRQTDRSIEPKKGHQP